MRYFLALSLYRIVLLLLAPIVLIVLILRSHNHPAYRARLLERLGLLPATFKKHGIIVHAASVGEVIALKPFIEQLISKNINTPITFTTFTPTGSAQVKKLFSDRVQHCYLPLDIWPCTALFLAKLQPKAIVFMETELWPNLIAQSKKKNIKLQLINGRLSDKSMLSYQKLKWLITPCLQCFDTILVQSEDNLKNFLTLGASSSNTTISGNLKFDLQLSPDISSKQQALKTFILDERKVWLVASTHQGDEEIALASFSQIKKQHPDLLLILVPRHPERFDSIFELCQQHQFKTIRRSNNTSIKTQDDIWLMDSLGELLATCALADIVTMGGSFSSIGGHNPLEPALFKKPIVVGHDMSNFRKVMEQLTLKQGVIQLNTHPSNSKTEISNKLSETLNSLLSNQEQQIALGVQAYQVVSENQGASAMSVKALQTLID